MGWVKADDKHPEKSFSFWATYVYKLHEGPTFYNTRGSKNKKMLSFLGRQSNLTGVMKVETQTVYKGSKKSRKQPVLDAGCSF